MRKLIVVFALFAVMVLPQMAAADTIVMSKGPYQNGSGGEFTALLNGTFTFQTFCIEKNEFFDWGKTYTATLNTNAVQGGVGPVGDPLSVGAAYLYDAFYKGILPSYDFANAGPSRYTDAGLLQNALWMLEGETTGYATTTNKYIVAVKVLFSDPTANYNFGSGTYDVAVLNLTDASGGLHQDVLYPTPIPAAAWLLGSGLLGLMAIRRRRK